MDIYHYDGHTGEYTGVSAAEIDPRESQKAGRNVYVEVPNSTPKIVPETESFETAVYRKNVWEVLEDYRGITVYRRSDRTPKPIIDFGGIPDGYTIEKPNVYDKWDNGRWVEDELEALRSTHKIKLAEINEAADNALKAITSVYPESEQLSWDKQEAEAREWLRNNTTKTPMLDAISEARNLDKGLIAQKVIEKADVFASMSGAVFGKRQRLETELDALITVEEKMAFIVEI